MKDGKNRVKVHQGMTQQLFVLSGELPSADYIQSTFFPFKNMHPGAQMNQRLNFDQTIVGAAFVPRTEADHLRFSSDNLPRILDHFSMVRDSGEAKQIEKIIKDCEEPCLIGEKKFCSTSLELMIDNVVSLLRTTNIEAFSTTVHRNNMIAQQAGKALYTISTPIKNILYNSRLAVRHQEPSPQAVQILDIKHSLFR
ncbi:BURP domain-containing protein 3-like [Carex rostrata]